MPEATRRTVLTAAGAGAAATLLGPLAASPALARSAAVPTRAQFLALTGRDVSLRTPGGVVRARVTTVDDLAGAPVGDAHRYSVLLKPRSALPDGLYRVTATGLGGPTLFWANVDRSRAAGLEAIVNAPPG